MTHSSQLRVGSDETSRKKFFWDLLAGRLTQAEEKSFCDLVANADLKGADLKTANLSGADLSKANLRGDGFRETSDKKQY